MNSLGLRNKNENSLGISMHESEIKKRGQSEKNQKIKVRLIKKYCRVSRV